MKSRHTSVMHSATYRRFVRSLPWAAAFLLFWVAASAFAQEAEADPPGRVAHLSARQGGVVFAPNGADEWTELPQNRPLTTGDRLWTDRGGRAELQLGAATMHMDEGSHLGFSALDERAAQFLLQQGTLNARVREIAEGENFEVGTPNLAFRALQPGDYRIDVAPDGRETRITVRAGLAAVFGERGQSIHLAGGQQATFGGRSLAQVQSPRRAYDEFDAWAMQRNRAEDEAVATRYVPRGVVGASQLDAYGTWSVDPGLGAVWFPQVTVQDWAPYRHGRWEWIQPWGWTWIDAAPWGFAPFHYGRWTMIADRWAWVPGQMSARPVYSPALVVFAGGLGGNLSLGSGPAVAWYPLAPGEAWWPTYRASPRYVSFANFNINLRAYPRHYGDHVWRHRPHAITAVREDDFRRGRPVHRHWQPLHPQVVGRTQPGVAPARPEWRRDRDDRDTVPRLQPAPSAGMQPGGPRFWGGRDAAPPAVRDQHRALREQEQLQRDAERAARNQQRDAENARRQDAVQQQREQMRDRQPQWGLQQREDGRREGGRGDGRWQRDRGDRGDRHDGERGSRGWQR